MPFSIAQRDAVIEAQFPDRRDGLVIAREGLGDLLEEDRIHRRLVWIAISNRFRPRPLAPSIAASAWVMAVWLRGDSSLSLTNLSIRSGSMPIAASAAVLSILSWAGGVSAMTSLKLSVQVRPLIVMATGPVAGSSTTLGPRFPAADAQPTRFSSSCSTGFAE